MRVSEIFHSIQGEGELCGMPSVFIRTSGCNLRCRWCDTPYSSWKPEGAQWTVDDLVAEVAKHPNTRHVVLTGGEPMLAPELPELAARIRGTGRHITIETAGTIAPGTIACDLASISPKLSGSTPRAGEADAVWIQRHESTRLQPSVLRQWVEHGAFQFKFVVGDLAEIDEIESLIRSIGVPIPASKVLLMPEGTDSAVLRARSSELIEWCKSRGYRFCDRLHVHVYGHKRGT